MMGQKSLAPKFAALMDIPLVFYGENEAEYGNPLQDNDASQRDWSYFSAMSESELYLGGTSITELQEGVWAHKSGFVSLHAYRATGD